MLTAEQVNMICSGKDVLDWKEEEGGGLVVVLCSGPKLRFAAGVVSDLLVSTSTGTASGTSSGAPGAAPGARLGRRQGRGGKSNLARTGARNCGSLHCPTPARRYGTLERSEK
jgi:hypothetical protein